MSEAPRAAKSSNRSSSNYNPFDAQSSDRDPFPSFEAALADEQSALEDEQQDVHSVLDWSIDTLAELKPVTFSPLPQQRDAANTTGTPHNISGFFEDENQYEVLRTPLSASRLSNGVEAASTNRNRTVLALAPSSTSPMELHRRCRGTITRCEAALQKRQCKINKLQALLPPPTPKQSLCQSSVHERVTSPSRSTPPRPAKRNRLSTANTPNSEWKSPGMRPPKWSASPIAMMSSKRSLRATPAILHFDAITPSPIASNTTLKNSSKLRLSFGLSPITSPSEEKESEEEKCREDKPSNEKTLPLNSSTEESEKENKEPQTQIEGDGYQEEGSSLSHAPDAVRTPTMEKSIATARSSIPRRRQQAFMEAMEAEARSSEAYGKRSSQAAAPISSLYQEAKRLGVTDPQSQ